MSTLLGLYVLGLVHAGFAGFREATGRNMRIRKFRYLLRAVLRGLFIGQLAAIIIFLTLILMGGLSERNDELLSVLLPGCNAALWVYGIYTMMVFAAFVPYLYPSLELRALTIVAGFSMLTLSLPLVMVAGAATAFFIAPNIQVGVLFAVSIAAVSSVEPILAATGWSARDAARENGEV